MTLCFGSPAFAHYQTEQKYEWSSLFGACIQTKVAHGEVTGGLVVQARTWSRTYDGDCDAGLNRIAGQIYAAAYPTLVYPSDLEVLCPSYYHAWNDITTNNYGVSRTYTAAGWENYCNAPSGTRLAGVSYGYMEIYGTVDIDVTLPPGTNNYAQGHPL